jgi:hypothetical protein
MHFQARKIEVDVAEVQEQYGCLNFHAKPGGQRAKLTIAVKNKWSGACTQSWFYCKVPLLWVLSPGRGKGVYALCAYMGTFDFLMEPPFKCGDDDAEDATFIKATRFIGGRDTIKEFITYGLYPLLANFGLGEVVDRETPVSNLHLLLPEFPIVRLPDEMNDHFCTRIELAAKNIMGGYARGEHDVCVVSVLNRGRVNWVFEQASVPYGPRSEPGSEACKEATRKRRDDASTEPAGKCAKVFDRKAAALKASVVLKSTDATSSKGALSKTVSSKVVSSRAIPMKADVVPKIPATTKVSAPTKAAL